MTATYRTEPALSLRVISTDAAFQSLRADWNRLVERSAGGIFLRHEWFSAAWAWRKTEEGVAPWIVCAYLGERLVGVLPLLRPPASHSGARCLHFLCVPDSQWCDALVDPDHGPAVGQALVAHLVEHASAWDVLRLERLAADSHAARWLAPALLQHGLPARLDTLESNLYVDLSADWSGYQASLSRSIKKTRNLAVNRIARGGTAQVQWLTAQNVAPEALAHHIDEIVAVSSRSWKHVTGNSLDHAGPQAFIRALTETAYAQGWLSVWFLRIDGRPIAMEYQLREGRHLHALRADFDDAYKSISPGTYLNFRMLQELFTGEHGNYYMGPGNNPYKSRWSDSGAPVLTLTSYAPTMRGRAGALWSGVKPTLRTWRDRLTP